MINKLLGFRRASHEDVPDEIVLNLSHKLKDWIVTSDVISPIWANLISKYDSLNPNRWDDNKKIKSELEAFYTSGYVDRVFSYNKFDHTNGHSNFTKILTDSGLYSSALTPSPFRDGYYLEIYNRV